MPGQTQRIGFGEYTPDLPDLANAGLSVAKNTVTQAAGYSGIRALANIDGFTAIDARPRGGVAVIDPSGNPFNFAGDETKLYRMFDATSDVTRASGAYNCSGEARWELAVYGQHVIAVNPNDESQYYTLGSSERFARLGPSTEAPRARHVGVVGSFLMMGNTFDSVNGLAENAIHWSAVGDPFYWPATGSDVAVAVQSDRQVLEGNGGAVQAVATGAEVGAIFQERSIWRADYRGGFVVFQLNRVDPLHGLLIPGLAVPFGRQILYLSEDGFYVFDYTSSTAVGRDRVDKTFLADVDSEYFHRVSSAVDPDNQRIWISYPSTGSGGVPNKVLIFDYGLNRWSHGEIDMEMIVGTLAAGVTLDSPHTDEDPDGDGSVDDAGLSSFDVRLAPAGSLKLGCYDTAFKLSDFSGAYLDAVLETGRQELAPGSHCLVTRARPLVDSRDPTVQVSGLRRINQSDSFGSIRKVGEDGEIPLRTDGRYHKFRVNMDGGFTDAIGMDVSFQRSSTR